MLPSETIFFLFFDLTWNCFPVAGIPPVKLVEAHGTFATASCTKCGKKYNGESIKVSSISCVCEAALFA